MTGMPQREFAGMTAADQIPEWDGAMDDAISLCRVASADLVEDLNVESAPGIRPIWHLATPQSLGPKTPRRKIIDHDSKLESTRATAYKRVPARHTPSTSVGSLPAPRSGAIIDRR